SKWAPCLCTAFHGAALITTTKWSNTLETRGTSSRRAGPWDCRSSRDCSTRFDRRRRLNSVIHLQSPNPNALRQKSENKWRDLGLESISNRDSRRWAVRIDQAQGVFGDQLRLRRILHVSIHGIPRFRDLWVVSRISCAVFDDGVVERGTNVGRLKINDVELLIGQFELDRHRECRHGRFRGVISS